MNGYDMINLVSAIASLILSVIAIWLSLHFYDKSKTSEKVTALNVNEIKTQTRALTDISGRMLDKFTDYATKPKAADESFLAVIQLLGQATSSSLSSYTHLDNTAQLRIFGVTASITTLFYTGLTNLAIQDLLPQIATDLDEDSNLPAWLNTSKDDFDQAFELIGQMGEDEVSKTELQHLYQLATGWQAGGLIKNMDELYTVQQ